MLFGVLTQVKISKNMAENERFYNLFLPLFFGCIMYELITRGLKK